MNRRGTIRQAWVLYLVVFGCWVLVAVFALALTWQRHYVQAALAWGTAFVLAKTAGRWASGTLVHHRGYRR